MTDLIKALEEAEKGSRELDFRIWLMLERDEAICPTVPAAFRSDLSDEFSLYDDQMKPLGWIGFHVVPRYSVSLDAAYALASQVLPGWFPAVEPRFFIDGEIVRWKAVLIRPLWDQYNPVTDEWFERVENSTASTPALALCAAILKAASDEGAGR